jgi:HK97 family phage major capsid protein
MDFNELSVEMQKSLTEFRSYVEREIKEVKASGVAAPETKEALERLNKRIDEIQAKMERPKQGGEIEGANPAYRKAFNNEYVRRGNESNPVFKAAGDNMNVGDNSGVDGGLAVPVELDRAIYSMEINAAPFIGICNQISVGSDNYQKLVNKHGATATWVGETDARVATKTPVLAQLTPYMGELMALAPATQKVLDDAMFNVEQFLADEIGTQFGVAQDLSALTGNGTNQFKGVLAYTTAATADATRAFGTIEHIAAGAAGDWGAGVNPFDKLVDIEQATKSALRNGARYVTNKALVGELRKVKDGDGISIWQPSLIAGQPSTIHGYPLTEDENVPAKGANSLSILFGNFPRAYTVCRRIGNRLLRDPFTNKPYVMFYMTLRVGGFLVDSEAVKVIKFAAA